MQSFLAGRKILVPGGTTLRHDVTVEPSAGHDQIGIAATTFGEAPV
jgi:hypothetical protein